MKPLHPSVYLDFEMLEVPAFVIGLSGLLPLIEKSLQLWQSISEANAFGSDLMGLVAQLSSEYSRFLLWARVSGVFEPPASGSPPQTLTSHPTSTSFPFPEDLGARLSASVEDAAARVVAILEEVSVITEKYKQSTDNGDVTTSSSQTPTKSTSLAVALSTTLPMFGVKHNASLTSKIVEHRGVAAALQAKTPFRRRFIFGTKPWGQTDKTLLQERVKEMCYWNDRLDKPLPDAIRLSVQQQALPGSLLVDENRDLLTTLMQASDHQSEAVRTHARLWAERLQFEGDQKIDQSTLKGYRRDASVVQEVSGIPPSKCELSLISLKEGQNRTCSHRLEFFEASLNHLQHLFELPSNGILMATGGAAQMLRWLLAGSRG